MDDKQFDRLLKSVEQMDQVQKKERPPSRVFFNFEDLPLNMLVDGSHLRMMERLTFPVIMATQEEQNYSLETIHKMWGELMHDATKKYMHDMYFKEYATHLRGRFIHQHKGKRKRQHKIKTEYVKKRYQLTNVWPSSVGDLFGTGDGTVQTTATFNYDTWGET